ncbi:MAG: hypothetical protein RI930_62 [Pseudomonadota bacterium]|jgi:hypothetical protein
MKGKIFNAQEVQGMISGNKTQFREVVKNQPPLDFVCDMKPSLHCANNRFFLTGQSHDWWFEECPYQIGQKIFCKESFREGAFCKHHFKADDKERKWGIGSVTKNFLPAQHMKQEHSRLTLQIKQIRVERLADISEEDAIAEGINPNTTTNINNYFRNLWNCTHKKPEEMFGANPWVFVYQFEVVK